MWATRVGNTFGRTPILRCPPGALHRPSLRRHERSSAAIACSPLAATVFSL